MPSSAFSIKKFDTKSPAICIPPPLPPIVPPPPLPKAIFFCFATFTHSGMPGAPIFADNCHFYYNPTFGYWYASPQPILSSPHISGTLNIPEDEKSYHLIIGFHWPPAAGFFFEWTNQPFSEERPYVGQTLTKFHPYYNQRVTANLREIPV